MASFGELVLVLGDLHIPSRAREIPAPFKRMLVPGKMQHVICTGNLSSQDYEDLRGLAPNLHVVAGDYDNTNSSGLIFPETRVLQVGGFRIGVVHGHQLLPGAEALARERRKLGVDILVSGHTHQNQVSVSEGCYYHINPGTITGAFSPLNPDCSPSFILLAIQDTKVVCYVYELVNGEVDVTKTEFTKKDQSSTNPALLESLLK